LQGGRLIQKWEEVQIPNNLNYKIRKLNKFEFGLNLFRVQTFLEKIGKFSKIPTCLDLPEYEFR
jgi:hypothetical protein